MDYRLIKTKQYVIGYCEISGEKSHKKEHETAYELLYQVLLSEFGVDAKTLTLAEQENGKPYFAEGNIFFNISHCSGMAVCAASLNCDVGVDVEQVRECRETTARRVMSDKEYEQFLSAEDRDRVFFQMWTYKESVLKLTGEGIRRSLRETDSMSDDRYNVEQFELTVNGREFIISCATK